MTGMKPQRQKREALREAFSLLREVIRSYPESERPKSKADLSELLAVCCSTVIEEGNLSRRRGQVARPSRSMDAALTGEPVGTLDIAPALLAPEDAGKG
jgi:hypothetical protein